jgi:hypothetical protein
MRTLGLVLLVGVVVAAMLASTLRNPDEPAREQAGPPAGDDPAGVPEESRRSRRDDVLKALGEYVELVKSSGGKAACRLFPEHYEPSDGKPLEPPGPYLRYPHPRPADGCRTRDLIAFEQWPSAPWRESSVERIGSVRFGGNLARVGLRIRTRYRRAPVIGRTPDVVEPDVVWLTWEAGTWRVARPSLLVYRVFESDGTPRGIHDPPVEPGVLSRPAALPRAEVECTGSVLEVEDPSGRADRTSGRTPAPWVDLTELRMSRAGGVLCLSLRTPEPIRPLTVISIHIMKPGGIPASVEVRLDSRGRPRVTTSEPPKDAHESAAAWPYDFDGARVGESDGQLIVSLPAKRLGVESGRFGWFVSAGNKPRPGVSEGDTAPNTRLHLYYAYPDGELITDLR